MRSLSLVPSLPSPNVEVNHLRWLTGEETGLLTLVRWLVYWFREDLAGTIKRATSTIFIRENALVDLSAERVH